MCIRKLSDITIDNTRMSVVCFGDSGVHLIELQILTKSVGKKVNIFLKDVCKKTLKGIFFYEYQRSLSTITETKSRVKTCKFTYRLLLSRLPPNQRKYPKVIDGTIPTL